MLVKTCLDGLQTHVGHAFHELQLERNQCGSPDTFISLFSTTIMRHIGNGKAHEGNSFAPKGRSANVMAATGKCCSCFEVDLATEDIKELGSMYGLVADSVSSVRWLLDRLNACLSDRSRQESYQHSMDKLSSRCIGVSQRDEVHKSPSGRPSNRIPVIVYPRDVHSKDAFSEVTRFMNSSNIYVFTNLLPEIIISQSQNKEQAYDPMTDKMAFTNGTYLA
ncbi:hypothetical protein BDR03DRAFT_1003098 [Suillus americanus]|nr:hypothetical protein BDR03DRAFT_1003098 [Suillus americanus]